jgi:CHAT domain-containing protein
MIALSLGQGGNTELVTAAEIKQWRLDGPVVALSGCSSGSADALPGEGLLGMSRAWLAAGAEAVVASLWPTPDDNGGLFVSFYRSLRRVNRDGVRSTPALALQEAQLEMLRSSTWRSEPRYWAAHFVAGKE